MYVIVLQRKCPLAISKWRKVKTWEMLLRFLRFFDMTLQKNVKSRVFWNFKKNVKNVFSNYDVYKSKHVTYMASIFNLISCVPKICYWSVISLNDDVGLSSIQWRASNRQGRLSGTALTGHNT